jgi:hypothetical protein
VPFDMNLAEALAVAVLKGDTAAAYALVDRLQEQRADDPCQKSIDARGEGAAPVMALDVYHWPEFMALCKRLGVLWGASTEEITIHLPIRGIVKVDHKYQGVNRGG